MINSDSAYLIVRNGVTELTIPMEWNSSYQGWIATRALSPGESLVHVVANFSYPSSINFGGNLMADGPCIVSIRSA